jgi:putative ABC transport system permease protein
MALKTFGSEDVIGKMITLSDKFNTEDLELEIVGVLKNISNLSTIQGEVFINIKSNKNAKSSNGKKGWSQQFAQTFIHVPGKIKTIENLSKKITDAVRLEAMPSESEGAKRFINYDLQRLDAMYFHSSDINGQKRKGSVQFVNILLLVGILTLLLAVLNYVLMNLGLNLNRAYEFKIRRYLGASKITILVQLIVESVFNASIGFVLTIISYPLLNSFIADILGSTYQLSIANDAVFLTWYFVLIVGIGVVIGTLEYIFSYNSNFSSSSFKSTWKPKRFMIIFQLFLFVGLLICLFFVNKQINFIQHKDLGYNPNNVVSVASGNPKYRTEFKNSITSKSYVKSISAGDDLYREEYLPTKITIDTTNTEIKARLIEGDANYLKVHGIQLLYGSDFNASQLAVLKKELNGKSTADVNLIEVLVNENLVKKANLTNPIGAVLKLHGMKLVIIGVIKNVHNTSMYHGFQPLVIIPQIDNHFNAYQISVKSGHKEELVDYLKNFYVSKGADKLNVSGLVRTFNYKKVYEKELQLKRLLEAFIVIVLFISILGMIAISLFITESKTKEIGIRKVNGATIKEIILMLNRDFIKWVLIAFVLACPIAYYLMNAWLENFAYKTTLSWWVFALAGILTLLIALITVSWQTYKAATQNPVKSLRDE